MMQYSFQVHMWCHINEGVGWATGNITTLVSVLMTLSYQEANVHYLPTAQIGKQPLPPLPLHHSPTTHTHTCTHNHKFDGVVSMSTVIYIGSSQSSKELPLSSSRWVEENLVKCDMNTILQPVGKMKEISGPPTEWESSFRNRARENHEQIAPAPFRFHSGT